MEIRTMRLGMIGTNCYIFWGPGSRKCGIVDPGDNGERVAAWLAEQELEPEAILLTHGHFDHILGIPGLRARWPELPVYCHPNDMGGGQQTVMFGQSFPTVNSYGNIRPYREGDVLTVGGVTMEVLETPGHTPGSVTLKAEDVLFTGDTLFQESMGRTDLPGGDEGQIMASLKWLGELEGEWQVCPGHEGQSTLGHEREFNPYMRAAMGR